MQVYLRSRRSNRCGVPLGYPGMDVFGPGLTPQQLVHKRHRSLPGTDRQITS